MSKPLLTIIVPTYRRSGNLALLLRTLREETAAIASEVIVLVSDNCSPDDTPEVVARAAVDWPNLRTHRQPKNVGAERNFYYCVRAVDTRWFWIIGDDDLPKRGVIAQIVTQLRINQPALLYMQSEWVNPVVNSDQGEQVGALRIATFDNLRFASSVHVWMTFISGMVVDRDRLRTTLGQHAIDRFDATSLVQLGWVLPLLTSTGPFLLVRDRCILATKDNSGGYALITVFGVNFTRIVNESFGIGHPLSNALINGNLTQYLPGRIWGTRDACDTKAYLTESPWNALEKQLGSHLLYWVLLVPLGRFPRWLAQPFFQTWRILNRLRREWQQRFGVIAG